MFEYQDPNWSRLLRCPVYVVEDAVHHGRSPADPGNDHVAVDGLGDAGGLVPAMSLISWIGTPLLLMIETTICRPL